MTAKLGEKNGSPKDSALADDERQEYKNVASVIATGAFLCLVVGNRPTLTVISL